MDSVIPETRVALDATFLRENIIVLPLKIPDNFLKSEFIVDIVTKAGSIDNREGDANTILLKFWDALGPLMRGACLTDRRSPA